MFGRGIFLKGKNFHSIVIVVPLHVSKFYRVLKKLRAEGRGGDIDLDSSHRDGANRTLNEEMAATRR
jgi:hypothetical protein